jgi:pimeloyl-ACP methyl ester carboxylesterase
MILIVAIVTGALYFISDFKPPENEKILRQLGGKGIRLDTFLYNGLARRYLIREDISAKPLLCFIQGAPMILIDFSGYIEDSTLFSHYNIIVPERLGYGISEKDKPVADIRVQSQYITSLIQHVLDSNQQVVILSHSYGGPIGAMVCKYLGNKVSGHVMLAPVIDPDHEKMFWFSSLPMQIPFSYFMSSSLKTATIEKITHSENLRIIKDEYADIQSHTIHFHGTDDFLSPVENIQFVLNHFDTSYLKQIVIPGGNHFIDFSLVKNELVQLSKLRSTQIMH